MGIVQRGRAYIYNQDQITTRSYHWIKRFRLSCTETSTPASLQARNKVCISCIKLYKWKSNQVFSVHNAGAFQRQKIAISALFPEQHFGDHSSFLSCVSVFEIHRKNLMASFLTEMWTSIDSKSTCKENSEYEFIGRQLLVNWKIRTSTFT